MSYADDLRAVVGVRGQKSHRSHRARLADDVQKFETATKRPRMRADASRPETEPTPLDGARSTRSSASSGVWDGVWGADARSSFAASMFPRGRRECRRSYESCSSVCCVVSLWGSLRVSLSPRDWGDGWTVSLPRSFRSLGDLQQFQKCPGRTAVPKWSVTLDGDRVITITRNACTDENLTPSEARQEANRFMPPDAGPPTRFVSDDGWPAEHRRSASLAKRLPVSAFASCEGRVAPGTFSYVLSPERSMWMLTVGTCP
jgi:hypothetical protein